MAYGDEHPGRFDERGVDTDFERPFHAGHPTCRTFLDLDKPWHDRLENVARMIVFETRFVAVKAWTVAGCSMSAVWVWYPDGVVNRLQNIQPGGPCAAVCAASHCAGGGTAVALSVVQPEEFGADASPVPMPWLYQIMLDIQMPIVCPVLVLVQ